MKINCEEIADAIMKAARSQALSFMEDYGRQPRLAIIQVGDNPASNVYVKNKIKSCEKSYISAHLLKLPEDTTEEELLDTIDEFNFSKNIDGIIIQLPLPAHFDEEKIMRAVYYNKDVDGFHPVNVGLLQKRETPFECASVLPATVHGINVLLSGFSSLIGDELDEHYFEGKKAVVVGRSEIVGKPCAQLLLKYNMTVTICHSHTKNLEECLKDADVIVVAAGVPGIVKGSMIKDGALVIDVGINRVNGKLCGDFDPELKENEEPRFHYTPVPGGVGKLTTASVTLKTIYCAWNH